ncbi:MAG: hypothetical protein ACRC80_35750 [Waterburya sp.]
MKRTHQIKTDNKIKIEDLETTEFQNLIKDLNDEEISIIVGGCDCDRPHPGGCKGTLDEDY